MAGRAGPGQVTAASHHNWHYTDTPATAFLATRAGQHLDTPPPDSGPMMRARASGDACCSVMVLGVGRKPPSGDGGEDVRRRHCVAVAAWSHSSGCVGPLDLQSVAAEWQTCRRYSTML